MDFTYYSAKATVLNALKKVKDEKSMSRVSKFLKQDVCPECHGSRINKRANSTLLGGKNLTEVCHMSLRDLTSWLPKVVDELNDEKQIRKGKLLELNSYLATFKEAGEILTDWDDNLWMTVLDKAIVNRDGTITFKFIVGIDITI